MDLEIQIWPECAKYQQDNEEEYKYPLEEEDIRLIDETAAWLELHRYSDVMDVDLNEHSLTPEGKVELSKACLEMYAYFSQHKLMRKKIEDIKEFRHLYSIKNVHFQFTPVN